MAVRVVMPQAGQDLETGTVTALAEGRGRPGHQGRGRSSQIETEKISVEVEAPATGMLLRILVPDGTEVADPVDDRGHRRARRGRLRDRVAVRRRGETGRQAWTAADSASSVRSPPGRGRGRARTAPSRRTSTRSGEAAQLLELRRHEDDARCRARPGPGSASGSRASSRRPRPPSGRPGAGPRASPTGSWRRPPSAGCRPTASLTGWSRPRVRIRSCSTNAPARPVAAPSSTKPAAREPAPGRHQDVAADGVVAHEPGPPAVLGHQRDAGRERVRRARGCSPAGPPTSMVPASTRSIPKRARRSSLGRCRGGRRPRGSRPGTGRRRRPRSRAFRRPGDPQQRRAGAVDVPCGW